MMASRGAAFGASIAVWPRFVYQIYQTEFVMRRSMVRIVAGWNLIGLIFAACVSAGSGPVALADEPMALRLDPRCQPLSFDLQGPFVAIDDGGILAIDVSASHISRDGGRTWEPPRPLFDDAVQVRVSNERALLRTRDGVVIAAFMNLAERNWTWKNELHDAPEAVLPTYVMRSLDDGKTWQDVQKLHDDWTGAVRDMIQTRDGRVVFTAMKMRHDPGRHSVLTYSSTDGGKHWTASNLIDLGGRGHHGGVTEPTLTELKDGRIWMLIRTNWGEFWSAYSHDGGRFWRIIQPSGISASSAPGLLKRLASGRLLLLWNRPLPEGKSDWPLTGGDGLWSDVPVSNHREELSLALSDDDGRSWSEPVVIARQPGKWLAYPYAFEPRAGEIWITTMQGGLRVKINESDFASRPEK
ncbi:MAG: exo-alpha-sialidase [Planctomycetales bacterium]|nr:exo-alpha-sialidase [Planctomycetales bacterium]